MGIPVIAIGVPTVVDAATIASDTLDLLLRYLNHKIEQQNRPIQNISVGPEKIDVERTELPDEEYRKEFMGEFGRLSEEDKIKLLEEVLTPNGYNMMVTPKKWTSIFPICPK